MIIGSPLATNLPRQSDADLSYLRLGRKLC